MSKLNMFSCFACNYLGPAVSTDYVIPCPQCKLPVLQGTWTPFSCNECGFSGNVFTPIGPQTIPCNGCGIPSLAS